MLVVAVPAVITAFLVACTAEGPEAADLIDTSSSGGIATESTCATPNQGCSCDTPGEVVECGKIKIQVGDDIQCDMGNRTCGSDGKWGDCESENTTRTVSAKSLRFSDLQGAPSTTCSSNACDPYCNQWAENPTGSFDAGAEAGFTIIDGGLTVTATGTFNLSTCTGITVTPVTSTTLTLQTLTPSSTDSLQFTSTLTPAGCYPGTPNVIYTIDDSRSDALTMTSNGNIGTLTAVSPIAGPVNVVAHIGSLTATVPVLVNVNVLDTSADTAHASSFPATTGTTDSTNSIIYPYANTLFPLGLPPPIPQWSSATAAASVKVSIRYKNGSTSYQWAAITPEGNKLQIVPGSPGISIAAGQRYPNIPATAWQYFERSAKGQSATIAIQRLIGSTLYAEVTQTIKFANGQMKGNVYYQSYGTRLSYNYSGAIDSTSGVTFPSNAFGAATLGIAPGATAPTVVAGKALTNDTSGTYCRVCHTVSSDGSTLITQKPAGSSSNGASQMFTNLTAASPTYVDISANTDGRYAWPAIYPTGGFLFANAGTQLSYSAGPPPGGLDGSNASLTSQFWSLASSTLGASKTATYKTTGTTSMNISIPSTSWGLQGAVPSFSSVGDKIAMNFYGGKVCALGTSLNCSTEELKAGDKRSLAIMDWNNSTNTATNFRVINTESTTSPCNTSFHPLAPCTDLWPTFLPNDTGLVWEREIFHNGLVGGGLSDFGGTRGGCDNSGTCNNDGTKGELWWTNITGTAQPTRLNAAIGLDSSNNSYLPVGPNASSSCTVSGYACTSNSNCCSGSCNGGRCTGTGYLTSTKPSGASCVLPTDCDSGRCLTSGLICGCAKDADCNGGTCNTLLATCSNNKYAAVPTMPYTPGHNATVEPELSYEPTMNPTPTKAADGTTDEYYWVVFTSRRMFGNIATQDPWWSDPRRHDLSQSVSTKKLWVAAVKANPSAGVDPSAPAFYLPGQEWVSGNSKAYWVANSCVAGSTTLSTSNLCDSSQDCCTGSTCKLDTPLTSPATRHCVPTTTCAPKGNSCSTSSDCCSGLFCSNNSCTDVPPLPAYGQSATYNRDYVNPCTNGNAVQWGTFEYQGTFPTGTSMTVKARTSAKQGDGGTASVATASPEVTVGTATATTTGWTFLPSAGTKIDTIFKNNGAKSLDVLRVEMTLNPSSDKTTAPTLSNWRVNVECTPNQ